MFGGEGAQEVAPALELGEELQELVVGRAHQSPLAAYHLSPRRDLEARSRSKERQNPQNAPFGAVLLPSAMIWCRFAAFCIHLALIL